jgi:thiol-disulfide isomerase/thioredoxin
MNKTTESKRAGKVLARCSWLLLAASLGFQPPSFASAVKTGEAAPPFSLDRLDGKVITSKALKGKVVVLDFWASWCAPCIASMPAIAKLQRDYGSKGLVVLGVTLDDDNAKLKAFLARRSPGVTVVKPTPSFNRDFGTLLHLKGDRLVTSDKLIQANLPTWILIDRKGRLAAVHPSSSQEKQMLAEAAALASRS